MGDYKIQWDSQKRVLEFALIGGVKVEQFAAFVTDFKKTITGAGPGPFYVLADISQCGVQPPEAAGETEKLMRWSAEKGMVRAVNLLPVATAAVRSMQMNRLVAGAGAQGKIMTSTDRADAMRKLLG